jgi:hypothetical protein
VPGDTLPPVIAILGANADEFHEVVDDVKEELSSLDDLCEKVLQFGQPAHHVEHFAEPMGTDLVDPAVLGKDRLEILAAECLNFPQQALLGLSGVRAATSQGSLSPSVMTSGATHAWG